MHELDAALAEHPDAVMMLRVQLERMNAAFFPNAREYATGWGLTRERWSRMPESTTIMHPGPMNRGFEISSEAADSAQSVILQQVTNGVFIRMAVLYTLLTGAKGDLHD
jgi:aspartate carbamoyltransferase catalytic subunit